MIDVISKVYEHLKDSRKAWKPSGNYASQAGHPCERNLVYQRTQYDQKLMPEPAKLLIFRDGNTHERDILSLLKESGFEIVEQQRPFDWKEFELSGRIDGRIKVEGKNIPLEIKTANHFSFQKINTQEDIEKSSSFWVRGYLAQMYLYLLMSNEEEGVFIFKNKDNGQLKQINIKLNYEAADEILKKLERVNAHVRFNRLPERILDTSVCQYCEFRHICLPDQAAESINVEDSQELLELLEEREKLKEAAGNFDDLDEKIKGLMKAKGAGEYLIGGRFQIRVKAFSTTSYDVPKEIKDQYKTARETVRTEITKL